MYQVIQTKKEISNDVTGTDDVVEESTISKEEQMLNLAMDMFKDKIQEGDNDETKVEQRQGPINSSYWGILGK